MDEIIGTWDLIKLTANGRLLMNQKLTSMRKVPNMYEFRRNGDCLIHRPDRSHNGTWKFSPPNEIYIELPEMGGTSNFNYHFNKSYLIFEGMTGKDEMKFEFIKNLTGIIKQDFEDPTEPKKLGISYLFLNKNFEIYSKTGLFQKKENSYDSNIFHFENEPSEWFSITPDLTFDITNILETKPNDKVSIAIFGKKGGMFIIYNHQNGKYRIYPEAVDDLYHFLESKPQGLFSRFSTERKIKKAVNEFEHGITLQKVVNAIKKL